jgi:hypothetical protein
MRLRAVGVVLGVGLATGVLAAPVWAGSNEVTTPIGSLSLTIDGGAFTQECTDFPYEVVVTGASSEVQWSAEIEATGSRGAESSAMSTDFGSGTVEDTIMICSSGGTGHGTWTAAVSVQLRNTLDTTEVYNRAMELTFTVSKATSVATITSVSLGSVKTKVKGTVRDASGGSQTTMFGYVTIQAKKAGGSWRNKARVQVDEAGSFTATIDQAYAEGTKFKAVFAGTDEAKSATSATWRS